MSKRGRDAAARGVPRRGDSRPTGRARTHIVPLTACARRGDAPVAECRPQGRHPAERVQA